MVYHVCSKSIAGFVTFNTENDFDRMTSLFQYYQCEKPYYSFSKFMELQESKMKHNSTIRMPALEKDKRLVDIVTFCIMPTHIHLILKKLKENSISIYMSNILNSYARYFNIKHGRKGHLWEGKYKKILIETDDQLLHVTRYIHLNPVTAYMVNKPEDWPYSSYREYLKINHDPNSNICNYADLLDIKPNAYKDFVESGISYQRELAKIKTLFLE